MRLWSEWGHRDRPLGKHSVLDSERPRRSAHVPWSDRVRHCANKSRRRRDDSRTNDDRSRHSSVAYWARLSVRVGGTLETI